jgi:hypothetical protein
LLKPDLFFAHLFVRTPVLDDLERRLTRALNNEYRNYQMIFLEGFSRTGKTTFINHFLQAQKEAFRTEYIDFSSLDQDGKEILADNPITRALKSHLLEQPEISSSQMRFIHFLAQKRLLLAKAAYFSQDFITELKRLDTEQILEDDVNDFFKKANKADTLILFFLYYCWSSYNKDKTQDLHLIIFDNLDSVDLNRFTAPFIEEFGQALERFSSIPQNSSIFPRNIYFSRNFKFLFCLREANNAMLNAHVVDRLRTLAPTKPFRIGFDSELYQKMVLKRLDFFSIAQKINANETQVEIKRISSLLKEFSQDEFFTDYIAPLFNFNFTRLSGLLYDAMEDIVKDELERGRFRCGLSFEEVVEDFLKEKTSSSEVANNEAFGAKGIIFFGVIKQLYENDFLSEYPFTDKYTSSKESAEGYCLVMRMILSVILNSSNLRSSEQALKRSKPFQDVPLRPVIRESLKIYPNEIEDVFEALTKAFLLQGDRLIHLLTFRNRVVDNEDEFKYEIEKIKATGQIPETLKDVYVTLNPAGFIFLKFLLPQFEFYSVLAGNNDSLFSVGLTKEEGSRKYLFERYIENVQRIVKLHVVLMNLFYEKRIKHIWPAPEDYLRSKFVFKHFGKKGPRDIGVFHATRMLPRQIQYLDRFRRWLLQKNEKNIEVEQAELRKVNQKLVGYIENYIEYMESYLGGFGDWVNEDKEATFNWYIKPAKERIEIIRKSNFYDFTTRAYLDRGSKHSL